MLIKKGKLGEPKSREQNLMELVKFMCHKISKWQWNTKLLYVLEAMSRLNMVPIDQNHIKAHIKWNYIKFMNLSTKQNVKINCQNDERRKISYFFTHILFFYLLHYQYQNTWKNHKSSSSKVNDNLLKYKYTW